MMCSALCRCQTGAHHPILQTTENACVIGSTQAALPPCPIMNCSNSLKCHRHMYCLIFTHNQLLSNRIVKGSILVAHLQYQTLRLCVTNVIFEVDMALTLTDAQLKRALRYRATRKHTQHNKTKSARCSLTSSLPKHLLSISTVGVAHSLQHLCFAVRKGDTLVQTPCVSCFSTYSMRVGCKVPAVTVHAEHSSQDLLTKA